MKHKCDSCGKRRELKPQYNFGELRNLCDECRKAANAVEMRYLDNKTRAEIAQLTYIARQRQNR